MTLPGPQFPLTPQEARDHLADALGAGYGGPKDPPILDRALTVDAVVLDQRTYLRPWATAARLIRDNTEYEVTNGVQAQVDRKLRGLDATQARMDALAGILHRLLSTDGGTGWPPVGGAAETRGVF